MPTVRVLSWNMQGSAEATKCQNLANVINAHNIDLVALQERSKNDSTFTNTMGPLLNPLVGGVPQNNFGLLCQNRENPTDAERRVAGVAFPAPVADEVERAYAIIYRKATFTAAEDRGFLQYQIDPNIDQMIGRTVAPDVPGKRRRSSGVSADAIGRLGYRRPWHVKLTHQAGTKVRFYTWHAPWGGGMYPAPAIMLLKSSDHYTQKIASTTRPVIFAADFNLDANVLGTHFGPQWRKVHHNLDHVIAKNCTNVTTYNLGVHNLQSDHHPIAADVTWA